MRKIDVGILKSCLGLLSRLRPERGAKKVFQELDDRDVLAVQQFRVLILEREYIPDHIFGGLARTLFAFSHASEHLHPVR